MKKFFSFFVFILLTLSLTSCGGNGIKKYKNEVSREEFSVLREEVKKVNFDRDFTLEQTMTASGEYEATVAGITSKAAFSAKTEMNYEVDFDEQRITEKTYSSLKGDVNADSGAANQNLEVETDYFYQQYENKYLEFNRKDKTGKTQLSFNAVKNDVSQIMLSLILDLSSEDDEDVKYFVDKNIYTIEVLDDEGNKAVGQVIIDDKSLSVVMVGDTTEIEGQTKIKAKVDLKMKCYFKKVSLKEVDVTDYNILDL